MDAEHEYEKYASHAYEIHVRDEHIAALRTQNAALLVVGRLTPDKETGGPRIWSAQDGTPKASFEITASEVRFLSSAHTEQAEREVEASEELPF